MKIGITMPVFLTGVVQQRTYLGQCLRSLVSAEHELVLIPVENYVAPQFREIPYQTEGSFSHVEIIAGRQPQSIAKAWNTGLMRGIELGCDFIIVTNTDVILKSTAIDRLVEAAHTYPEAVLWSAAVWSDLARLESAPEDEGVIEDSFFSFFMVRNDFFTHVGYFDENFAPAYIEDSDMRARLALARRTVYICNAVRVSHFRSSTLMTDESVRQLDLETRPKNHQYFREKWGHRVVDDVFEGEGREKLDEMRRVYFAHPYNEPERELSYWRGSDQLQRYFDDQRDRPGPR